MYWSLSLNFSVLIFLWSSVHNVAKINVNSVIYFEGGKKTPATLAGDGDEFQVQAEKDSLTSNKGKVIKR